MNTQRRYLLITGGAGFIGSHLVRRFVQRYSQQYHVVNLDALTYAGNLDNLSDIADAPNYTFVHGNICDAGLLDKLFRKYAFSGVIHCAAESHVDRSIEGPLAFVNTNVLGTAVLLQAARVAWAGNWEGRRFYHISTDEVYGSLGETGLFTEQTPYDPRSPYSASKAASDHLVRAFYHTYGLPVVLSNCSNNYGSHQFPEKLIPLCINNILHQRPLPVYGEGLNVRDWLYVEDHVSAIDLIYHQGALGRTYNIGGHNEWRNIDLVRLLCDQMDQQLGKPAGTSQQLITFVRDRAGHDHRYAIDASLLQRELGWVPSVTFEQGLARTVAWYLSHRDWIERVTSGQYRSYYSQQYHQRS